MKLMMLYRKTLINYSMDKWEKLKIDLHLYFLSVGNHTSCITGQACPLSPDSTDGSFDDLISGMAHMFYITLHIQRALC